jgi:transcriptional regulator with XRE-family HTH domain
VTPPEPIDRFASNLRRYRKHAGLSQERLAAECGVHRTEISLLERGGREPRLSTIVRLARALAVSPGTLLEDVDERRSGPAGRTTPRGVA